MHKRIIEKVNKIAKKEGVKLRQTYTRTTKQLMIEQRFRNHPKRKKKANAAARKIKTIAGRMVRDLEQKLAPGIKIIYQEELELFFKVIQQKRTDKNKIYSLHELAVDCIAKGKEAKKYEFGNKSGFVLGKKSGIVLGAIAFENNPFDGHTVEEHLSQTEQLTGKRPKVAIVDRGYRGKTKVDGTEIVSPKPLGKNATAYQKRKARQRFRARAGIEPIIGHIRHVHRMLRNYLRGITSDKINTILAATAFNFKKNLSRIKAEVLHYYFIKFKIVWTFKTIAKNLA